MPNNTKLPQQGLTLLEIVITITLISIFTTPFILTLVHINKKHTQLNTFHEANYINKKNLETLAHLAQTDWNIIDPKYDPTPDYNAPIFTQDYYLDRISNNWQLIQGTQTTGIYTTKITFEPVCHDNQKIIQPCSALGSTLDLNAIQAISQTTWNYNNKPQTVTLESIYTNIL